MAFKNSRKLTAGFLSVTMLAGTFLTGFAYQDGIGNVYYETKAEIYDNTYYSEQLAGHSANGIERAYIVNADIEGTDLEPYVFEGEVTGTYTMDTMVSTLESQGYKVVTGINGDLYDTNTGAPKGLTIHDGKIKTSGYAPEYVISFDEDGKASLEKVNLGYALKGTINIPTTVEVPVTDPAQSTDPTLPTDPAQTTDPTQTDTDGAVTQTPAPPAVTTQTVLVPTDWEAPIGFFNIPHGGAKALHLFNRQYASSTKTRDNSVEVILQAGSAEEAEPTVGGTINATVLEVRNGTSNTPIGANQLVLSASADSPYAIPLSYLAPGSQIELSVTDWSNGGLSESKEAIGVYYAMYDNGQWISNGTNLNPRTAIGIKPDGSILLYVLDGRQPGFSAGLGLTDMAKHLIAMGCTTVVNMDGGGSTVMNTRLAGKDSIATEKNSPSGGAQRKTTNGLLLVYRNSGGSQAKHLHTYASQPLAMPGADIQLTTYASNDRYEPVSQRSVTYSVEDSLGTISQDGLFTAGSNTGTAVIHAESGSLETTTEINIENNITFTTNVKNLVIDPGKSSDINVSAAFGYSPIASKDSLFTFSCDDSIGTIDTNGLFQATSQGGITGNIYVAYNGTTQTIPVQIGATLIDFKDTTAHWAREYIGRLAARGVVNGMGDNYYQPDATLTRAQFLTMLSKTIFGLDPSQTAPAGFTDVPDFEWYYNYVNWGYANAIVNGTSETTFAPNDSITREQMAIMLTNFARSTQLVLPETNTGTAFTDSDMISPWASEAVNKIVLSGIMSGYPEGNYNPQGKATRAEAATVIYKLIQIRDNIAHAK